MSITLSVWTGAHSSIPRSSLPERVRTDLREPNHNSIRSAHAATMQCPFAMPLCVPTTVKPPAPAEHPDAVEYMI